MKAVKTFPLLACLLTYLFIGSMYAHANNQPPTADIDLSPNRTWFYNEEQVEFNGTGSHDNDEGGNSITAYAWSVYVNGALQSVPGGISTSQSTLTLCFDSSVAIGSVSNGCMGTGGTTVRARLVVTDDEGDTDDVYTAYLSIRAPAARRYFLTDHLGSVRATVDEDGYIIGADDYYPFGLAMPGRSSNSANPNDNYKFIGEELDDEAGLNLMNLNARTYDSVTGRFLQIDPLFDHPAQIGLSPYNYSWNNPLNLSDPKGLCPRCDISGNRRARQLANGEITREQYAAQERAENRANFRGGLAGAMAVFSPGLATRLFGMAARNPAATVTTVGTVANAVDPNPGADHLPGNPVDNVGNALGQAVRNFGDDGASGISRALTAGDFGLADDAFEELSGTFSVSDGIANVTVDMFDGALGPGKGPLKALTSLIETAKSHGATEINITATFANQKLMDLMSTVGELTNRGGDEVIRIVFD